MKQLYFIFNLGSISSHSHYLPIGAFPKIVTHWRKTYNLGDHIVHLHTSRVCLLCLLVTLNIWPPYICLHLTTIPLALYDHHLYPYHPYAKHQKRDTPASNRARPYFPVFTPQLLLSPWHNNVLRIFILHVLQRHIYLMHYSLFQILFQGLTGRVFHIGLILFLGK